MRHLSGDEGSEQPINARIDSGAVWNQVETAMASQYSRMTGIVLARCYRSVKNSKN